MKVYIETTVLRYWIYSCILSTILNVNCLKFYKSVRPLPVYRTLPCGEDTTILSVFNSKLETGYNITVKKDLEPATDIRLIFDSQAAILVENNARFSSIQDNVQNIFNIILLEKTNNFTFTVLGQSPPFSPPYLTSLKINDGEICSRPNLTYFADFPVGVLDQGKERHCGRRKVFHTELIVHGTPTKAGDWPWHAAILRYNGTTSKYTCGGTLLNKYFVLTAAHCASISGIPLSPDILGVVLGKYHLYHVDIATQRKEVHEIFIHEDYASTDLSNDIALLKLRTKVTYNNYVQPACLWSDSVYDRLPFEALGTVVGWGFDQTDSLSSTLHAANMPRVPDLDCIFFKPEFYGNFLRDKKRFCAGYTNGTTACNGDSGGGFTYFVPDVANYNGTFIPGAWYIKGIVSMTLSRQDISICDPNAYAIFIDVAKYLQWIRNAIGS